MKNVIVIGASRGLGLEFVRQYLADGWGVTATARRTADAKRLTAMGAKTIVFDAVKSPLSALARAAAKADLVIYNAGVYGKGNSVGQPTLARDFDTVMRANVFGALRIVPTLAPKLAARGAKLVFISSSMGSMTHANAASGVVYRASKAALNMAMRATSLEFGPQGLTTFVLHPGWVKTDMGGPNAALEPSQSVGGMRQVIAGAGPQYGGKFYDYAGNPLSW